MEDQILAHSSSPLKLAAVQRAMDGVTPMTPLHWLKLAGRHSAAVAAPHVRESVMSAKDKQVGGTHYQDQAIEPIDYILGNRLEYCEGNIVKYISRYRHKGGKQDLEKVIHYAEFLIEKHYGEEK